MISVRNLSISIRDKKIVHNVSLDLSAGKISVIIGKNGAGKSTLLKAITGNDKHDLGLIDWGNRPNHSISLRSLAQQRAVLAQNTTIDFPISVNEVVEIGTYCSEKALSNEKIAFLIKHALREVNMQSFALRDFRTLSGGEQKRILLAKCIAQLNCTNWADKPKYLFLDEPTASLDIQQQHNLISLIKKLVKRRNIGVLAVLHDINLAAQLADELIILKEGAVFKKGGPRKVLTSKVLKEAMGIKCMVEEHPFLTCPFVTVLPSLQATHY